MKTIYPNSNPNPNLTLFLKRALLLACFIWPFYMNAQNLITNSGFDGGSTTGWSSSCSMEVYPENTYGGSSSTNYATEIDKERCLDQTICVMPGVTYNLSFKGTRRIDASTPNTVGVAIKVTGVSSGNIYVSQSKNYSNTSFAWTTQTYSFAVASSSTDRKVTLHIEDNNNHSTYGVIMDDIELHPSSDMTISGTTAATVGSSYNYSVVNSPSSGITYNWNNGADATPATSTAASPLVSWSVAGNKSMSVAISNNTCVVTSLSASILVTGVLPLNFTSFTGNMNNNKAMLTWTTANEVNNSYFVVERSVNGRNYDSVGRVQTAAVAGANSYSFSEVNNNSISYYRIRQVDIDGGYTYSSVITLKNAGGNHDVAVYPSIATTTVQYAITNDRQAEAIVQVFNITGEPVLSRKEMLLQGSNLKTLTVTQLPAGAYWLRLHIPATGFTTVKQFQKQ
jgi:hypothetical protein